jgi:hypothetical protein
MDPETKQPKKAAQYGRSRPSIVLPSPASVSFRPGIAPYIRAHSGARNGADNCVGRHAAGRRPNTHLAVEDVEGQMVLAAYDGADLALQDCDFFGAIHAVNPELQR